MFNTLKQFMQDESGDGGINYVVVVVVVVAAVAGGVILLRGPIARLFNNAGNTLSGVGG